MSNSLDQVQIRSSVNKTAKNVVSFRPEFKPEIECRIRALIELKQDLGVQRTVRSIDQLFFCKT